MDNIMLLIIISPNIAITVTLKDTSKCLVFKTEYDYTIK